jgi:hypothetical protein
MLKSIILGILLALLLGALLKVFAGLDPAQYGRALPGIALLFSLICYAFHNIFSESERKGGKMITEDRLERLIEKEVKDAGLKLPAVRSGEIEESSGRLLEVWKETVRGRIKDRLLHKHGEWQIKILTQQKEILTLDAELLDKAIEKFLLKESITYQIAYQKKAEELELLKKEVEIAKVRRELEELQKPPETLPVIVPDELEELQEEERKRLKKKVLRRRVKAEIVEELLREKEQRLREIENLDLPESDKERLRREIEEDLEYTIKEVWEGGEG